MFSVCWLKQIIFIINSSCTCTLCLCLLDLKPCHFLEMNTLSSFSSYISYFLLVPVLPPLRSHPISTSTPPITTQNISHKLASVLLSSLYQFKPLHSVSCLIPITILWRNARNSTSEFPPVYLFWFLHDRWSISWQEMQSINITKKL